MAEKGSSGNEQKLLQPKKKAYFSSMTMEKCSFKWTVENFGSQAGDKTTPLFPSENDEEQCKWTLTLNSTTDINKYLGLVLTMRKGPGKDVPTVFELKLKTGDDRELCRRYDDHKFNINTNYTWQQLPKIKHLKKDMDDDEEVLVIELDITSKVQEIDKYYEPEPPIPMLQMVDNYASLRKSGKLCDAKILVEGVKIPVHSVILAARSPMFMAAFEHSTVEKNTRVIEVNDVDVKTLQYLLDFVYSCELPDLDTQKAMDLLKASNYYGLLDLKEHCAVYLAMSLNTVNVIDVLLLADMCSVEELKERAIDFICVNKSKFTGIENSIGNRNYDSKLILDILRKMSASL